MIAPEILQEIEQIIYRYSFAMDTGQWQEMSKVFTPDGRIILGDRPYSWADGVSLLRSFME